MMKSLKLMVGTSAVVMLLSGCMSGNYGCPGMPDGVMCKRPSEIYALTNNSDNLTGAGSEASAEGGATCGARCQERKRKAAGPGDANKMLTNRFLEPINQPMPIREAPQIMRVWVAPYNDENDDLHWPTFVFTEITKRRWAIGEKGFTQATILTPLQVDGLDDDEQSLVPDADASAANPKPAPKVMKSSPGSKPPISKDLTERESVR